MKNTIKPSISIELITPAIAKEYLGKLYKNERTPNTQIIKKYSDIMLSGGWNLSEPIEFDTEGRLYNGQHRLNAVILSGCTITFYVARNMDPVCKEYVDRGQKRTTAQIAKIKGKFIASSDDAFSVIRAMFHSNRIESQQGVKKEVNLRLYMEPDNLIRLYEKYEVCIRFACTLRTNRVAVAAVRAAITRAYFHFDQGRNRDSLIEFINILNTGIAHKKNDNAAIKLRDYALRGKSRSSRTESVGLYLKTEFAIQKFIEHSPISRIQEAKQELFPMGDFDVCREKDAEGLNPLLLFNSNKIIEISAA